MSGPTCRRCDRLYPEGAEHESCAEARIYNEGGGWLWLGPLINESQLVTTPEHPVTPPAVTRSTPSALREKTK